MARPRTACVSGAACAALGLRILVALLVVASMSLEAQEPQPAKAQVESTPGQFFPPIVEPIESDDFQALRTAVTAYLNRAAAEGQRPVLIFEFRPSATAPDSSRFGTASDLADYLAGLGGARTTVAYVPESLAGYDLLPVLACDEIVLGPDAALGPIASEGEQVGPRERAAVEQLARAKGRDPALLLGLLEPGRDLREVRTADGGTHFLFRENLDEFAKDHQILAETSAWGGRRGVLPAEQARRTIARLLAADRAEVARAYNLRSTALDPTLQSSPHAVLIPIEGTIDTLKESFLRRQIASVRAEGANLVLLRINSPGGLFEEASKVADAIADLEEIRTVAYIDDRALGVAALIPLACDQIVFDRSARMGDVSAQLTSAGTEPLEERLVAILADRAESLARAQGHPAALARALVDPQAVVQLVRDTRNGVVTYVLDSEVQAEPGRYEILETIKSADDSVLTLNADTALKYGLAGRLVESLDELRVALDLPPGAIHEARHTWVDALVDTLNARWMKGLLLLIGFFMLVLELKLPGIGLPSIISGLAFLLYFWSSYLGGTADQLEIMLFLVGLICLALELFVFPGFGVFGMSGVLLVLVSVVMASHTFIWPTQEYEYRQLGWTLAQITGVLVAVLAGAIVLGRYFPSLPLFSRLVLKPEPTLSELEDPTVKPALDLEAAPLGFLIGEVGRTTTVLRPSGKARFGELLVDVTADGAFLEADRAVEVIEVHGSRVIVKPV